MIIRKERTYAVPIERVWAALTTPEALSVWFMEADFKAEVGYSFRFKDVPRGKWDGMLYGEVLVVEELHHLAYTWQGNQMKRSTEVRWTLESEGDGTRVRLEHIGFEGFSDGLIGFFHRFGWRRYVRQLQQYLQTA